MKLSKMRLSVARTVRRPFTGAWIETSALQIAPWCQCRPFTGAWIETDTRSCSAVIRRSPLHGGVD